MLVIHRTVGTNDAVVLDLCGLARGTLRVLETRGRVVKLGFQFPRCVQVARSELLEGACFVRSGEIDLNSRPSDFLVW